jgi:hypothetical protein
MVTVRLLPSCPTTVALSVSFRLRLANTLSKAAWLSVARLLGLTKTSARVNPGALREPPFWTRLMGMP